MTNPFGRTRETPEGTNPFGRHLYDDGKMSQVGAFASGAADAFSFGFGDELEGLLLGEDARDEARRRQERARADRPGSYFLGQVGGSLAGGIGVGGVARAGLGAARLASLAHGVGPMTRIGLGAAAGGVGAALYGAGDAPDEMRAEAAINNFIPGAVFGAGGQALGEVAGRVGGAVQRSLSPEASAGRMMAESLERFGPPTATANQAEQHVLDTLRDAPNNAMVSDVVPGFTQLVRGAGVRPSRQRDVLRDAFDKRNNEMGKRATDDVWKTLNGTDRLDAADAVLALRSVQEKQARPLYAQAYSQRVDPQHARSLTSEIVRRHPEIFGPAQQHAQKLMLAELGQEIADPSDPRYWHYLLQGAERELGARLKAGRMGDLTGFHGSEAAVYTRAVQAFNTQVRRLLGHEFRQAQDIYSGAARAQEAVLRGYDAVKPNLDSLDLGELMQWMRHAREGEVVHMRLGALNKLSDLLENADAGTGRSDVLRSIMRNAGQRRVLERIFGGEQRFTDLMRRLDIQRDLFRNSVDAGIGVNSHTADRLAAMNSQQMLTQPATGIRDRVIQMLTRDATDRFDEGVSNSILETAGINANQAAGEIAQAGGFSNWAGRRGLLSRAIAERKRMLRHRPDALVGALSTGLYAPVAGAGATGYGGL